MKVIIIGNGLAGTMAAKTLRELDQEIEIQIYGDEKYSYYPRPNLIEFLAGNLPYERLFAFPANWHTRQQIEIHLESPVKKIFPDSQEIEISGKKREKYDILLLANGASPFVPPIKGADKQGVFSLRTLDNAFHILDYLKDHKKAVIIGGGILGLETARALKARGAEVLVVEFFDRLLPRQLDSQGAELLKKQIEKMGIQVRLGVATEKILGTDGIKGLRLKGGDEVEAEMAIVAAGVRPNLEMAKEAGLATERGLVVNDHLQTSHPKIFAAGDNVQHKGRVYGIIPASFDQARAAAYNILNQEKKYEGTIVSNTLKVVGLQVTSAGLGIPEGQGFEEIRKEEKEKGIYKKIVLQNGALVGAIWMGTKKGVAEISNAVSAKKNIEKWKEALLEDNFDFSKLNES